MKRLALNGPDHRALLDLVEVAKKHHDLEFRIVPSTPGLADLCVQWDRSPTVACDAWDFDPITLEIATFGYKKG